MPASPPELFNAADYLVHRRVADGDGDRVAVEHAGPAISYAELSARVGTAAAGLAAIGVRPEERVMFFAGDTPELAEGILGAMHLGAVAVPVSTMLTSDDLCSLLADSRARVLVTSTDFVETARTAVSALVAAGGAAGPELTRVLTIGTEATGFALPASNWTDLMAGGASVPPYASWADSPALWLYTSGTTGSPKAAMHRHTDIRFVCETYGRQVLGIRRDDRCFSVAKLFFAYGIGNSMFFPFSVGATTILESARPTPELIAGVVARHRPTLFFGVPTFYSAMLNAPIPDEPFADVRQGISAGEPLPATLFTRIRDRFGFEILDGIGSTEALHIFLSNSPGAIRPGSSGTPVPGYAVEIRDETDGGVITDAERPGGLYIKGESIATGYWCRADISRRAFQGEWLRTGDTYVRNADGTYSYLGRSDDMIKAGGIWVSPSEVEARLLEHPDVVEVAVVGLPDADGLDKPLAAVVTRAGTRVGEAELVEFCRAGLAAFKRPRRVVLVDELPKTATGKLQRYLVRSVLTEAVLAEAQA
ncbi:benzoate-CoA ligase family protein [Pseudonocardia spinosispora]|uniref:benzoate-CoA ligase family protein n=1 Tax=Pseudonocardia spinosispora TaxID=103441 RepID=UPI0004262933|nr:benzoate-CoA ligase family protein [Pseudonocardia spinosispora]